MAARKKKKEASSPQESGGGVAAFFDNLPPEIKAVAALVVGELRKAGERALAAGVESIAADVKERLDLASGMLGKVQENARGARERRK